MLEQKLQTQDSAVVPSSDRNRYEFLRDMQDLFSEKRFAHIGHWRFSEPLYEGDKVNGLHYWNRMLKKAKASGQYYIFSDEVELIQNTAQKIGKFVKAPITLVDLGPGSEGAVRQKIAPLIQGAQKPITQYIGVDIAQAVLDSTRQIFAKELPTIEYSDQNKDFFEQSLNLPQTHNVLMVIFGVTMFNLPINPLDQSLGQKTMVGLLRKLRSDLTEGAHFIVTQDSNPDIENIIESYKAQDDVWLNVLERIKRDLPVNEDFDTDGFDFEPYWVPETYALCHTYVCKKDMSFLLGDRRFRLKSGQRFYLHNSYKYPIDYFCELAKQAGFNISLTEIHDSQRMALHLFETM